MIIQSDPMAEPGTPGSHLVKICVEHNKGGWMWGNVFGHYMYAMPSLQGLRPTKIEILAALEVDARPHLLPDDEIKVVTSNRRWCIWGNCPDHKEEWTPEGFTLLTRVG